MMSIEEFGGEPVAPKIDPSKTREEIIQWVIKLMADTSQWKKDPSLGSSHCFVYLPMVQNDDKGHPSLGSLYVRRDNGLYGNGGYNVGIYGEYPIYVCPTWNLFALLKPLNRKFWKAFWGIDMAIAKAKATADNAHDEARYLEALEKISTLVK